MTEVFTKLKHLRFMNSYISSVKKFALLNFVKMEKPVNDALDLS